MTKWLLKFKDESILDALRYGVVDSLKTARCSLVNKINPSACEIYKVEYTAETLTITRYGGEDEKECGDKSNVGIDGCVLQLSLLQ